MSCWQGYFIGKRRSYIKRTSPILELQGKICGELSTLVLLKKHHFMRTDFAGHLTFSSDPVLQFKEEFKWA